MYYIALHMLLGDKSKYFAMVFGVAIAACMMTQQPAIFVGLLSRTYSFVKDVSEPDIWVMNPGVQYVEASQAIRDIELLKVKGINGVKWAVPMFKASARAKLSDGSFSNVDLTGLDDATLIGAPYRIITGNIDEFRKPDAIFVDINAATSRLRVKKDGKLRPLRIGDIIEINNKRSVVVGFIKSTRNFILQPQIFTTYSNALKYLPPSSRHLAYILVKAGDGVNIKDLTHLIRKTTGLEADTSSEFKRKNLDYWMQNTGIPINFGITVLLGFIVGAVIAGQTFYGFVLENRKHYAVLKAMGIKNFTLIKIVMLQAIMVGFVGYGIGVGITTLIGIFFQDSVLAFRMPPWILLFTLAGVSIIILISALIGIKKIISIDPATVFRDHDDE